MTNDTWCIILAAGEGRRLQPITRALYGHPLPKQFASIIGEQTMLQATVERFAAIAPPERTVVVVAAPWVSVAREQLARWPGIEIVAQPADRGTGPGLLLPLISVRARASDDVQVVVTPSDHHFLHLGRLQSTLLVAARAAREQPTRLVLLGAVPDHASEDLGWIVTRAPVADGAQPLAVASFVEKPPLAVARRLSRQGALWNTFVMVASVRAFWSHAARQLPQQAAGFERYLAAIGTPAQRDLLEEIYQQMERADFSRDVLEHCADLLVARLEDSGWSDWGTPKRLLQNLRELGHLRAFRRRMGARQSEATAPELAVLL